MTSDEKIAQLAAAVDKENKGSSRSTADTSGV